MQQAVLVRGSGDIGSAIAHRLFRADYQVVIHDIAQPTATRRGMAFADAAFDGEAILEGVLARRVEDVTALLAILSQHTLIPLTGADFKLVLQTVSPQVLVDARMRKHAHPEPQRGLVPLTIGLGPNFVAGKTTDLAIETSWGDTLGHVVAHGAPLPLGGEPRPIEGVARERYVYAPAPGVFHTELRIGDTVRKGQVVAQVGSLALTSPLNGVLRGLVHDGVPVTFKTKLIEVDPRGDNALIWGIGERPALVAEGVLQAIVASRYP